MNSTLYMIEFIGGMIISGALIMLMIYVLVYTIFFAKLAVKMLKNKFAKTYKYELPDGIVVKVKLVDKY